MPIPIDFENFLGIHAGKTKPPRNSAQILENFDLRGLSGALEQRTGYNLLYDAKPLGIGLDVLTTNHLVLENIYIPEVGGGKEIQIVVGNGIATSQQDNDTPYTKDVCCVWASHKYHPGSNTWTDYTNDGWNWLNEIVFTTVRAVHGTDLYKIRLDIVSASYITDDYFKNFTVVNLTTGEVLKVIGTFEYSATNNVGIYISSENHNFTTGDELALMRTYVPMAYVEGNSDATANEISIVKINNDIKIGFGGFENRVGLTVGYRKYFLAVKGIEFGSTTLTPLLDNVSEIDGLVCNPHSLLFDEFKIGISTIGSGTLTAQVYYLRLIGVLDDLSHVMLDADVRINIAANQNFKYSILANLGKLNERLTEVDVYLASEDNDIAYQLINSYQIRDLVERFTRLNIDDFGYLNIVTDTTEFHSVGSTADDNAASTLTTGDVLTTTHWEADIGSTIEAEANVAGGSENVIYVHKNNLLPNLGCKFTPFAGDFEPFTKYTISIKMFSATTEQGRFSFVNSAVGREGPAYLFEIDNSWTLYTFDIETGEFPEKLHIEQLLCPASSSFRFDLLSIKKKSQELVTLTEPTRNDFISDVIGYSPSLNIVKSWDQAKLTSAKILMVNAYIKERNLNKIFFSHISGLGGASMWDAVTASGYYDTESSDGNDLKGIELLRNLDLLTLNSNSNLRVDSETGRSIDLGVGSGTENIKAAVNLGDRILYPGKFDILATNGVNTESVSFGTVSETYRALTNTHKGLMRAIREENKSSYRFYLGNSTSKEELILTPFGWQSAKRNLTPASYALKRDGTVLFLNGGYIYQDIDGSGDNQVAISSRFKSIPIDNELIPEMKADDIIVVTDWWLFFFGTNSVTMNLYLDYSGTAYDTQIVSPAGSTKTKYKRPVKVKDIGPASCSCFEFELICAPSVIDTYGGGKAAGTIISAGLTIEIIPGRLHA